MKQILWFCFAVAAGLYVCGPLLDPDLWWHITAGRWMLANFDIPGTDHWTMFAQGQPWCAYSWSSELVYALVDGWFGEKGLLALQMVFSTLLALSLCFCLGKTAKDWFFGGLLGVFITAASFNHFSLRPQVLVWILFAFLLYVAGKVEQEGLNWPKRFALFSLMLLWANTHISTFLGILGVFLWLYRKGNAKPAFQAAAICFLGTLVTPYLGGEWLTFIGKGLHPFSHGSVMEFQPANILERSTGLFLILMAPLGFFVHRKPASLESAKLVGVVLFSLAALAVVKFLPFAEILAGACLAELWKREAASRAELGNLSEAIERLRKLYEAVPREGLAFLLICLSVMNGVNIWRQPQPENIKPQAALDFVIEKKLQFPLLNDFGTGGYVMYRLSDSRGNLSHPVSMDGRTNLIPSEIWEKEVQAFYGRPGWRDYIEAVKPATILWLTESPLTSILTAGNEWCRVMKTGGAEKGYSIFIKKSEFAERRKEFASDNCQ